MEKYSDAKFRRIVGMRRKTFARAVEILNRKYAEEHTTNVRKSGRKPKLSMEDKMVATMEYLREYRTLAHIGASYDIDESNTANSEVGRECTGKRRNISVAG